MATSRITLLVDGRPVTIEETGTIRQLYERVGALKNAAIDSFHLTYGGQPLDLNRDGGRLAKEYHFRNNESLVFTQRSRGGSNLQPLEGHVQLTKEPCCVTLDEDDDEWRAKLTCRHAISVSAVHRMLTITLQDGGYEFKCPSCRSPIQWIVVRHILSSVMSKSELQKSLETINTNFVKGTAEIRQCSSCKTNQVRDFSKKWYSDKKRVVCNECTRKAGTEVSFCWDCRQPWRPGFKGCGNTKCDGGAAKLTELMECSTKTIDSVSRCPKTRACPRCGVLIDHTECCKHMTCKCGCNFCFVCLKLQYPDGRWPCGSYSDPCTVAARQTSLPD